MQRDRLFVQTNYRSFGIVRATYGYTDERGRLLYQIARYEPKAFSARCLDGRGGWIKKKHPYPVLYRLPEVLESPIVFLVEREKDVETLRSRGFVATTKAFGASQPCQGDENSSSAVGAFMHGLRRLAHLGATVILLHHTGQSETSQDYRGSSDFKAAVDVGFTVWNYGENGELRKVRLKAFKNRFTVERELLLNYSHGRFSSDDRPNATTRTVTEQLTELLKSNPGIKAAEFERLAAQHSPAEIIHASF
ncbi:MAG TPA: hypothetical protein VE641_16310 [Chthoniobacterales bacterium]|nr:hypothetical protein [Chthoniobacterales bacterium]